MLIIMKAGIFTFGFQSPTIFTTDVLLYLGIRENSLLKADFSVSNGKVLVDNER